VTELVYLTGVRLAPPIVDWLVSEAVQQNRQGTPARLLKNRMTRSEEPWTLVAYEHSYDRFHVLKFGRPHDLLNATYLQTLSSHAWRSQDHYRVLSLGHMRRRVTPDVVRAAYRALVLRWHPDKCGGQDDVFKCMQKAANILQDEDKCRAFDSVDPTFDEDIPDEVATAQQDFFALFGSVFERNAIFSRAQPVPLLGDPQTPRESVEAFYDFWNRFDSWRSFEYVHPAGDGADSDHENRMDKRYKEKQARAAQSKAKARDNARLGRLVDLAYRHDPRIIRWRQEDLERKQARKLEREQGTRSAQQVQQTARLEVERVERERQEAEQAARKLDKERREQERNALKQERKLLKGHFETHGYFSQGLAELEEMALLVERLLVKLTLSSDAASARHELSDLADRPSVLGKLRNLLDTHSSPAPSSASQGVEEQGKGEGGEEKGKEEKQWTASELDLLIQAVKLFPGGVPQRWQRITEHINVHLPSSEMPQRAVAEVTRQAEQLKESGGHVPPTISSHYVVDSKKKKDPRIDQNEPSLNPDSPFLHSATNNGEVESQEWTREEQARLEKAMRMVPSTDSQRWDKIAKLIPSKTKRQILERVKSIAAALKK
jgi:DnaJ family protein C protein 2